jgi:hypothetical protein
VNILSDLGKIPDGMYFKATKTLEIIQVILLNKLGKEKYKDVKGFDYSKDVIVVGGDRDYRNKFLTRDDIINNFINLDGSRIKIAGWHYGVKYNVCRPTSKPVAVLRVPNRMCGIKSKYRDSLLVFNISNDRVDTSRFYPINNRAELRLFKITHRVNSLPDLKSAKKQIRERNAVIEMTKQREELENKTYRNPILEKKEEDVILGAPYTVIGVLLKRNQLGKSVRVGFRIKRKKDGVEKDCNFTNVKKMCINKELDNVTIVHVAETGKEHFRGVGIKIENLPSKYI